MRIHEVDLAPFAGADLLVIEDIVDSGLTLARILDHLQAGEPRSLEVCCLLRKDSGRDHPFALRYVGFRIPDRFVVGYGLDHAERYRNLPFVAALDPGKAAVPRTVLPAKGAVPG